MRLPRLSPSQAQLASRLLQAAIAVILVVGVVTQNLSVVINAVLALMATLLPAVLSRDHDIRIDPGIVLVLTLALFLHSLGMLGLYDGVWWFDHVTHTLSATLVAGVGFITARAFDRYSDAVHLPQRFLALYIVLFTLATGVLWEVLEFAARELAIALGYAPVLIQYGLGDTLVDLVFDAVGGIVFAVFGTGRFEDLTDRVTEWLERRAAGDRS